MDNRIRQQDVERFWSYVDRGASDACWPWLRGMNGRRSRYGVFYIGNAKWKSHRLAYEIANGSITNGMVVRHRCDRSECCNPRHLELGTNSENVEDRVRRGRSAIGERAGAAVYTEQQVRDLRAAIANGESMRGAGRRLGINPNSACTIASGRIWTHVAMVALCLAFAGPVAAQSDAAQSDETLLLRTCISERSWRTDVDDCVIVAEVVRARMERRGETFAQSIRALAPRLHGGTIAHRRWLLDLDVDCHRPDGWPRSASWERHRDACLETVAEVRAILAGSLVSPCTERPAHWGSRDDVRRRVLHGFRWRDAACPGATLLNRAGFLYRPRDVDPE
jgi:hypothetical protein